MLLLGGWVAGCAQAPVQTAPMVKRNEAVSANPVFDTFLANVNRYVQLRKRLDSPPLKDKAEPAELEAHTTALRAKLSAARSDAVQGAVITPEAGAAIKRILRSEFRGADGKTARMAVMESNPGKIPCKPNDVYPATAPVATVPPEVLVELPKLPADIEYRFVDHILILRDAKANMIIDCLPGAIS